MTGGAGELLEEKIFLVEEDGASVEKMPGGECVGHIDITKNIGKM